MASPECTNKREEENDSDVRQVDPALVEFNQKKDTDWYQTRVHSRSSILRMVFIGREMIINNQINVLNWKRACANSVPTSFKIDLNWQKLREPLRRMAKLYKKENDHTRFNLMLEEAHRLKLHFEENN